jgi:dephospho-CoA kinase
MSQLVIGLTGGIASGKTTVANLFIDLGVDVVDADIVAREVVAKNSDALSKISAHFGQQVLLENGELDRFTLRQIIFANDNDKQWLNTLMHPLIRQTMIEQVKRCRSPYCLLIAPLLIENNMQNMVNAILVVDVDENTQIKRTMSRDSCSEQQAKAILSSQISRKQRLKAAHNIIKNNGMINKLTNDVKKLHDRYSKIAQDGS